MGNIAVIGANATLSKYLIKRLKYEGHTIMTIGRSNCDIIYDLRDDYKHLNIPRDIDLIIHVAAEFTEKSDDEIYNIETINALGTLNVCIAAKRACVRQILLISSMSASLASKSPYYNLYAISKRHAEELADFFCKKNNIVLSVLRPSQIYDDKGFFQKHQPLLYLMVSNAEQNQDINIFGSHDAIRNYIYVDDLVEIIIRVIALKFSGVFACINKNIRLSELAKAALTIFHSTGQINFLKEKENIPDNGFTAVNEFYDLIKFKPQTDITTGMKKIEIYRKSKKCKQ